MHSSLALQVPGFLAPLAAVLTLMAGCGGSSEAGRAPAAPATGEPTTVAVPTPSAQPHAEPTSKPTPAPPDPLQPQAAPGLGGSLAHLRAA